MCGELPFHKSTPPVIESSLTSCVRAACFMIVSTSSDFRSEEAHVLIEVHPRLKVCVQLGLLLVKAFQLAPAFQAPFGGGFS